MSRETNSILLRYGLNIFWSTSISPSNLTYIKLRLDNFFSLFLQNYFFGILKIAYSIKIINVYVYYFKEDKYSFLYKFLTLNKNMINTLVSRKCYGFSFLKPNNKLIYNRIFFFSLLILINKLFLSTLYFGLLKKSLAFLQFKFILIKNFLQVKKNKNILKLKKKCIRRKIYYFSFFPRIKIKLINHLIKFKWLNMFSSLLIKNYTNKVYIISYKSLTEKSITYLRLPFMVKYLKNYSLKQKFYIIFLGFIFLKASIINNYVNVIIKKTKNKKHVKNLVLFFKYVKILFENQFIPLDGLKFKIAGRLGGKLRKGSFHYKLGFVKLMSFNRVLDYTCNYVYTQYGAFSLKLWLCAKSEHY